MNEIKNELVTKYWIAHNENYSVVHYGETNPDEVTTTRFVLDIFDNKEERDSILNNLGIEII